ncbi:helix-turn-helix transcriptional regulator [Sagittula marina]|uniref:helix-turn-helix transcriptional regulator n=1 Tax=Sagittula marina TaxID=943940 RepID=UPI0016088462|nr:LuxR family transcriptional regulator [Sagittula marina]
MQNTWKVRHLTKNLEGLKDAILRSNSVESTICLVQQAYDIDFTTFHLLKNDGQEFSNPFVRTTYPDAWVRQYLLNNYISLDPVIEQVIEESESFCWSELRIKPHHKKMLKVSLEFGLGSSGHSFVYSDLRGRRSVLSVNSTKPMRAWQAYMTPLIDEFETILPLIHTKGVTEALAEREGVPSLTSREHECLSLSSEGKSYSAIASELNLSEHTARSYLKMARAKLGCTTLAQAVGKAVRSGIL